MSHPKTTALFQGFQIIGAARIGYIVALPTGERLYPTLVFKNLTVDLIRVAHRKERVIRGMNSERKQRAVS